MRRAPERRRMRLWRFFRREREGICRARRRVSGPGRRLVQFCWAIRRPSTRTIRTRIAACSPKDAVAVPSLAATAACLATWAGGLLFGGDGVTGLRFRHARGSSPVPRPPRSPRQSRLRSRTLPGPVVRRERSEGSTRLPRCRVRMSLTAVPCRPGASVSIRPRRLKCGDVANPCLPVHLPGRLQNAVASRKRHPGVVSRKLRLPRPRRIPAGFPPAVRASPVWSEWLPTDHHTAVPRRRGIYTWH